MIKSGNGDQVVSAVIASAVLEPAQDFRQTAAEKQKGPHNY